MSKAQPRPSAAKIAAREQDIRAVQECKSVSLHCLLHALPLHVAAVAAAVGQNKCGSRHLTLWPVKPASEKATAEVVAGGASLPPNQDQNRGFCGWSAWLSLPRSAAVKSSFSSSMSSD